MRVLPIYARKLVIPYERGIDKEYRRPDDTEHIIRINQKQPKGTPRKIEKYLEVSGVSFAEHSTAVEALIAGTDRKVTLERDPGNSHDPNAIKVIGHWRNQDGAEGTGQIGWVPKEVAATIPEDVLLGATIDSMFKPVANKSAGLRISIWGPRRKK